MDATTSKKTLSQQLNAHITGPVWTFIVQIAGWFLLGAGMEGIPPRTDASHGWASLLLGAFLVTLPIILAKRKPAQEKPAELASKRITKDDQAVSPVIGVILMVAITVVLAAVVFVVVTKLSQSTAAPTPNLSFSSSNGGQSYSLVKADPGLSWGQFTVTGCSTVPTGVMTAGQVISGCTGTVNVVYTATNTIAWSNQ